MIALSVVTIGAEVSVQTQRLLKSASTPATSYLPGFSVETAEALAGFCTVASANS